MFTTGSPKLERLEYDEVSYKGHHDVLRNALQVGYNFKIQLDPSTNTRAVDFYFIKCLAEKKQAKDDYMDEG